MIFGIVKHMLNLLKLIKMNNKKTKFAAIEIVSHTVFFVTFLREKLYLSSNELILIVQL